MQRLVADPNSRVRLIAAGSLLAAESGNTIAGAVLMEALEDPAPRVREAALELLESLGAGGAASSDRLEGTATISRGARMAQTLPDASSRFGESSWNVDPDETRL